MNGGDFAPRLGASRSVHAVARTVVVGLLAFVPCACGQDKSFEEHLAEFEAESGIVFESCGDYTGCRLCELDADETLDTACPSIACFRDAWEACSPAKIDHRVYEYWEERLYVVPRPEGGCEVGYFKHSFPTASCDLYCTHTEESQSQSHCDGLRFSPPPCLEPSSCSVSEPL